MNNTKTQMWAGLLFNIQTDSGTKSEMNCCIPDSVSVFAAENNWRHGSFDHLSKPVWVNWIIGLKRSCACWK